METWYYDVVSIDGDYANLKRCDIESDDLKLVARALLPPEIMEGSRLKYELMQYEIICKRQTMRQSLKSTPPIIGDVASCIRPEDYLTMA